MIDVVDPPMTVDEARTEMKKYIFGEYGERMQKLKLCEECAELIQAVLKGNTVHIAEEMADVQILIDQLRMGLDLGTLVEEFTDQKLVRQIGRLKASKYRDGIMIPLLMEEALEVLAADVSDENRERSECDPTDWRQISKAVRHIIEHK